MSLILDALRKLDREKETPERGLVVLGAPEPRTPRAAGTGVLAIALILGSALGGAFALLWLRGAARGPAEAPRVVSPATLPTATTVAPVPAASAPAPPAGTAKAQPATPPPSPRATGASHPAAPSAAAAALPPSERAAAAPAVSASPRPAEPLPAKAGGAPALELRLEAISERGGRAVAILSGRLVFEGDSFEGIHVLRIGASEVEIERDGRREVLRF